MEECDWEMTAETVPDPGGKCVSFQFQVQEKERRGLLGLFGFVIRFSASTLFINSGHSCL